MRNPLRKPEVSVEQDEAIRGTGWRACSVRIAAAIEDRRTLQRVSTALEMLSIGSEVKLSSAPPGAGFTRFSFRYYGDRIAPDRIAGAVQGVL